MNDCAEARISLGAYVLGALEPAERARLEAHLEACPACRDELAGLAGLPAMLGRVDEAQLAQVAGPEPELLEGLLARAARERRAPWRRRPPWGPLAVAAAVLLVAGGLFGGLLAGIGDDGGRTTARPTPAAPAPAPSGVVSPSPPAERLAARDPKTGVKGFALLREKKWGTSVEMYLSGVKKGASCRLLVIARDGRRDMLGSWYVPYSKGYGEYHGSTMFPRDQLFSIEIVSLEGQPLLTLPA
ncbi:MULTISPECIES: anti-sigma factor family protein [Actinomadura]|uniref:Anti-sigma factor family protein n=1 Tax=Actinomadura yumaensis TaxID=111807 RepID=A0ABW2CEA5_9ACTN|nr:anti-sigma factor [Actinomadura sp. J1-007]MWK34545.1 hypothetical protein [Actinomadura sp. J1-007]